MPISDYIRGIRQKIGTDLMMMIGAAAIIINEKGEVLLQQRSDNGRWGNPGGAIDPGETPREAVLREVYEETGLHVEIERIVGLYGGKDAMFAYPNGDQVCITSVTFLCHVVSGEPYINDDESLALDWFSPDALPDTLTGYPRLRTLHAFERTTPYFYLPETIPNVFPTDDFMATIRQKIGTDLLMMPGVCGVIINDSGQVLLGRRSDNGLWGLPGGAMEPGEQPAETLIREVYEECNLRVRPETLIGAYGGDDYYHTYPGGNQVYYIGFMFRCSILSGDLKEDGTETLELIWFDPSALPNDVIGHHRQIIQHALTRETPYF